jgi:hypothetical protein
VYIPFFQVLRNRRDLAVKYAAIVGNFEMFDICVNLLEKDEEDRLDEERAAAALRGEKKSTASSAVPDSADAQRKGDYDSPLFSSPRLTAADASKALLAIINRVCHTRNNSRMFFEWTIPPLFLFPQKTFIINDLDIGFLFYLHYVYFSVYSI